MDAMALTPRASGGAPSGSYSSTSAQLTRRVPLSELLARAAPTPSSIRSADGGAVLALALHCLMVREGFMTVSAGSWWRQGRYEPAPDWNSVYENEWVFLYSRPGAAHGFRLHCSLQAQTQRMFVHASEVVGGVPDRGNIQIMGVQLRNYVPDPAAARGAAAGWEGAVSSEHTLTEMFCEFVSGPLIEHAVKTHGAAGGGGAAAAAYAAVSEAARRGWEAVQEPRVAVPLALGVAALAAAALLVRQRGGRGAWLFRPGALGSPFSS